MSVYVYGFNLDKCDGEMFFCFPKLPEIISAVDLADFESMGRPQIYEHAKDAVVTALQARIIGREDIPPADQPSLSRADGFVNLSTLQSMKMELYKLYRTNISSIAELARQLSKPETSIRRLLDLRHNSVPAEIDAAVSLFGKRIVSDLTLEPESMRITTNTAENRRPLISAQPG